MNSVDATRRSEMAGAYSQIETISQLNVKEQELTAQLAPLQFNRPLSDPERNSLIATMARLDAMNGLIILIAGQIFQSLHSLGFEVPADELFADSTGGLAGEVTRLRTKYGNCVNTAAIKTYDDIALRGEPAS